MSSSVTVSSAASSAWIPCNAKDPLFYLSVYAVVSGTLTYTVEHTLDNIQDPTVTPTVLTHDTLVAQTASASGAYTNSIRAVRITVTSWTSGSVTLNVVQGVPRWLAALNLNYLPVEGSVQFPYALKFPNWPANAGCLLASLAASSTASRTANVVTVSATGHGITTGTMYVGFRFYYPGSANLAADWYDSILSVPDANSLTFTATGPDFAAESINSGSAWTTATDIASTTIQGGTLKDQSKVRANLFRDGSTTGGIKTITLAFGGSVVNQHNLTTTPRLESVMMFRCIGLNKQIGSGSGSEGIPTGTAMLSITKDVMVDQIVAIRGTLSAASEFIAIFGAYLEIIQ